MKPNPIPSLLTLLGLLSLSVSVECFDGKKHYPIAHPLQADAATGIAVQPRADGGKTKALGRGGGDDEKKGDRGSRAQVKPASTSAKEEKPAKRKFFVPSTPNLNRAKRNYAVEETSNQPQDRAGTASYAVHTSTIETSRNSDVETEQRGKPSYKKIGYSLGLGGSNGAASPAASSTRTTGSTTRGVRRKSGTPGRHHAIDSNNNRGFKVRRGLKGEARQGGGVGKLKGVGKATTRNISPIDCNARKGKVCKKPDGKNCIVCLLLILLFHICLTIILVCSGNEKRRTSRAPSDQRGQRRKVDSTRFFAYRYLRRRRL